MTNVVEGEGAGVFSAEGAEVGHFSLFGLPAMVRGDGGEL
jgi:hypothetical protein